MEPSIWEKQGRREQSRTKREHFRSRMRTGLRMKASKQKYDEKEGTEARFYNPPLMSKKKLPIH